MTDTQFGQVVLLVTTVVGFLYTAYREKRAHQWAREERELAAALSAAVRRQEIENVIALAAAEAEATRLRTHALAYDLREKAELIATRLSLETQKQVTGLQAAIKGATVAAQSAYVEANNVNVKIENLNARLLGNQVATASAAEDVRALAQEVHDDATPQDKERANHVV